MTGHQERYTIQTMRFDNCRECDRLLSGKQRKFCSAACKMAANRAEKAFQAGKANTDAIDMLFQKIISHISIIRKKLGRREASIRALGRTKEADALTILIKVYLPQASRHLGLGLDVLEFIEGILFEMRLDRSFGAEGWVQRLARLFPPPFHDYSDIPLPVDRQSIGRYELAQALKEQRRIDDELMREGGDPE